MIGTRMIGTLAQVFGLVALLGAVAFVAVGFVVLKDRVHVTVQDDAADARPDPTALLRDDLQAMRAQLDELASANAQNFERLHQAGEAAAGGRHAELLAGLRDVATLRASLAELSARTQAVETAVQELTRQGAALAAAAAAAPPVAAPPEPAVSSSAAQQPEAVAAADPTPAPAAPADPAASTDPPAPAAPAAAATGTFLTFAVPKSTFRFDEPQDYVILPELSRVGFDAKSTLHDFSGVTSKIEGRFRADFDDAQGAWQGEVTCDAATLHTGVDGRDEGLREHLDTAKHPTIRFELKQFEPAPDGVSVAQQTARGEVLGTMTIRGKSRDVRMPVRVQVDASKRVVIEGEMPLLLSDYDVPVPNQLGLVKMQDEVKVWISLRARKQVAR